MMILPSLEWTSLLTNNFILHPGNFINSGLVFNIANLSSYLIISNNHLTLISIFLSIVSGIIVGFSLGLVGGGGSILAVPLLVYVIGLDIHIAIGTSALAVAANALINLFYRMGKSCIKIKEGILFAIPGALGTLLGAQLGLLTPSENLLILFALFMIIISSLMLRESKKKRMGKINKEKVEHGIRIKDKDRVNNSSSRKFEYDNINNNEIKISLSDNIKAYRELIKVKLYQLYQLPQFSIKNNNKNSINFIYYNILLKGFLVGIAAGYFGIGGGFLIVPVLIHTISGLDIVEAIGTSLIPISAFGFLTAIKYAFVGQSNLFVTLLFIIGGAMGGLIGTKISYRIPKESLRETFAIMLIIVAFYIILRTVLLI